MGTSKIVYENQNMCLDCTRLFRSILSNARRSSFWEWVLLCNSYYIPRVKTAEGIEEAGTNLQMELDWSEEVSGIEAVAKPCCREGSRILFTHYCRGWCIKNCGWAWCTTVNCVVKTLTVFKLFDGISTESYCSLRTGKKSHPLHLEWRKIW